MSNWYDQHASDIVATYEALSPEDVHQSWCHLLSDIQPGLACDIGAGSGRDARWLAAKGWDVVAVEQSNAMLSLAKDTVDQSVTSERIVWLEDALPSLQKLRAVGYQFDLILLSAVWQHVPESERERAFRILSKLLKPSGMLVITLRHGKNLEENKVRGFLPVSGEALAQFATRQALTQKLHVAVDDLRRPDVSWETFVFQLPDDGSGGLGVLRHIIVNDDKSSSYKLALLRVLTRIAEAYPGAVISRNEQYVKIPLGLVGLLWIKLYKPLLLQYGLKVGSAKGVGFAKSAFEALRDWSDSDLRVGASFSPERGAVITNALRDACNTITNMPAHFITWPGQNRQIFGVDKTPVRLKKGSRVTLDADFLRLFGEVEIPAALWQSMGSFACWLEPAIVNEWQRITEVWMRAKPDPDSFVWESPQRTTEEVREIYNTLVEKQLIVSCTWSGKRLKEMAVDHAFPWARWPNNDLWNLLPTNSKVNASKSDKLVASQTLHQARQRILFWWSQAYCDGAAGSDLLPSLSEELLQPNARRFITQASLSLPNLDSSKLRLDDVYQGMLHQRARLKADQQLVEWVCS